MSAVHDYSDHDPAPPPAEPHSIEIEQGLLGALLVENGVYSRVSSFLQADHFYDPVHRRIYEICGSRISSNQVADPKTIRIYLESVVKIGDVSIAEYLSRLAFEAVSIVNAEDYARIILSLSVRRKIIEVAQDAMTEAHSPDTGRDAGQLLEHVETCFADLRTGHKITSVSMSPHDDIQDSIEAAAAAFKRQEPTGWPWFLNEIEGVLDSRIEPESLTKFMAASGDGKTSMTLQQLRFLAESGVPALFLSGERSPKLCIWQMQVQHLSRQAELGHCSWDFTLNDIRHGRLTPEAFDVLYEDAKHLAKLPLKIIQWQGLKVGQIGVKVRAFVKRYGAGVFAIDHAQKIAPDNPRDIFAQQIFQVDEGVKNLAQATGCGAILICHRGSDFLERRNMRPIVADVYGKENGLKNADVFLALYRPERWIPEKMELLTRGGMSKNDRLEVDGLAGDLIKAEGRAQLYSLKGRDSEERRKNVDGIGFKARFTRFYSITQQRWDREPELPV